MKVTVLTDNIGQGELKPEWGLSLHIEFEGKSFLLDMGGSDAYMSNAEKLGIDLAKVDCAIISHAHFDHSLGLKAFLEANASAPVYLSPNAGENCYAGLGFISKYIGMPKSVIGQYPDRIIRPLGVTEISEGVFLVPHSTPGLEKLGRRGHLYIRKGFRYIPDDFSHEQTLVFRTPSGLVLLSSCSHSGPEVIVDEVLKAFPGEHITAYIGGLHLFRLSEPEVQTVSDRLASRDIDHLYTGHCTGQKAFELLSRRFPARLTQLHCGLEITI